MLSEVSAWRDAGDPQGYERVRDSLLGFATEPTTTGHDSESEIVRSAVGFYGGGSPSEFLGESRAALRTVLGSAPDLPPRLREQLTAVIAEIDEGFRAVGGG